MALSYHSTTRPGALSAAMDSSTTSVPLVSAATFPDPGAPGNSEYTIIVGYGSDREEVCTVTAKVGDTLTVLRGQDFTAATGKNEGDVVVHGVSARDFKSFVLGTDPRLTDARTPTPHAASHATGGSDPVTPAAIGAATPAALAAAVPIGTIIMFGGSAAPNASWHLCDGTTHGSTALQAVIGSANTPNLRDRFVVGAGGALAAGAVGGVTTHQHTHVYPIGLSASNLMVFGPTSNMLPHGGAATHFSDVGTYSLGTFIGAGVSQFTERHIQTSSPTDARPPYYALTYLIKKA